MSAPVQVGNTLEFAAEHAMRRAAQYLGGLQQRDGHWCAELTADTTLESDYSNFGSTRRRTASGSLPHGP